MGGGGHPNSESNSGPNPKKIIKVPYHLISSVEGRIPFEEDPLPHQSPCYSYLTYFLKIAVESKLRFFFGASYRHSFDALVGFVK